MYSPKPSSWLTSNVQYPEAGTCSTPVAFSVKSLSSVPLANRPGNARSGTFCGEPAVP